MHQFGLVDCITVSHYLHPGAVIIIGKLQPHFLSIVAAHTLALKCYCNTKTYAIKLKFIGFETFCQMTSIASLT